MLTSTCNPLAFWRKYGRRRSKGRFSDSATIRPVPPLDREARERCSRTTSTSIHSASTRRGTNASSGTLRATEMLRSEEHTSELQSRGHLVCRLLLEKKNKQTHLIQS